MELIPQPLWPWHWLTSAVVALAALALLVRWGVDLARRAEGGVTRTAALVLSLLAGLGWVAAAWNPLLRWGVHPDHSHLVVVVDVSDSMLRSEADWAGLSRMVQQTAAQAVNDLPAGILASGTASIVTFRTSTAVRPGDLALADLPAALAQLGPADFAFGDGTNLSAALGQAGQLIQSAGGTGAILLVTDGQETEGEAAATAATLGRQGIPIFIYPYAGAGPQVGIAAADLPAQVEAGATTYVRGVLHNWSATPADLGVMLTRNTGQIEVDGRFGATATVGPVDSSLAPNASDLLRVGVTFEGRGLQFVDVAVNSAAGEQRRRFFTMVSSPPRILAIGGDNGWLAALPPGAADIVQMGAEAFDPATALVGVDAVVISGVFAQQFKPGALATLAEAVQTDGLGLLLFNGRHPTPADETSATVIMSYADTPLGPLLPVTGGLREAEPPARQVAIIIDSSGSMAGEPLDKAKQITHYIIANLLRPQDRLTLISFTTDYKRYTDDLPMDAEGKQAALQALEGIEAKGGTEPSRALEALAGKRLENCGLIFLSDGGFSEGSWVTNRPDCRATVFAIGYAASPAPNEPIAILADPIPVGGNFDPANVSILYFDPHRKSWETASVPPRAVGEVRGGQWQLPVPDLPLDGWAVAYARPEAELIAVAPKFADPVLAYREDGAGYVGAFTSYFPAGWLASEAGRAAIAAWVTAVLPLSAPERYALRLVDRGPTLELQIGLVAADGHSLPAVSGLTVEVVVAGETVESVALQPLPEARADFAGVLNVPRGATAQLATLLLREAGPEALARPQRVPLLIPPVGALASATTSEALTYGMNEALLASLAQAGGGRVRPPAGTALLNSVEPPDRSEPLWPWLTVGAGACYLAALGVRRFRR